MGAGMIIIPGTKNGRRHVKQDTTRAVKGVGDSFAE